MARRVGGFPGDWQAAGVWRRLHGTLLNWLGDEAGIDRSRASLDGLSVRAECGGEQTGPNRVDRGERDSKYHLVVDRNGVPLAVRCSGADVHDSKLMEPLIDAIPPVVGPRGRPGRPRFRPAKLHADKAYDSSEKRRSLRARGITPRIARRGIEPKERLGQYRWIAERGPARLVGHRRLGIRCERRSDIVQALLHLACASIRVRFLRCAEPAVLEP